MSKITSALGLILIAGMIAVGCDSVVDGDTATHESLTQIEGIMSNSVVSGSQVLSPMSGEVVYQNTLSLMVEDLSENDVAWAVRPFTELCNNFSETLAGNVNVNNPNDYEWDGEKFNAEVDIETWDAGKYCFAFNTRDTGAASGSRLIQYFYIVDEYAKVGGTIGMGDAGPGNSATHSFDGVVGNAGSAGTVGSITVNDREGEGYCTLIPTSLNILASAAGGERALMYVNSTCWGDDLDFRVLDRDNNSSALTRGGVYFPELGLVSDGGDPFYNWVPMERGNNHVGMR